MDFLKTLKAPSPVFPNDSNKLVVLNSDSSIADAFQVSLILTYTKWVVFIVYRLSFHKTSFPCHCMMKRTVHIPVL